MRQYIEIAMIFVIAGFMVGYTFSKLNDFNTRVNYVLAP